MTEWTIRQTRHIPEDELHAYLDQALSRSQCVEIETHLSACRACQAQRASVAALRDRTTALLSDLAPRPVIVPPEFQALREQHRHRIAVAVWKARVRQAGLWAAGVVAAVGAGWAARSALDPHQAAPPIVPLAQAPTAAESTAVTPVSVSTADIERQATPLPIPEQRAPLLPTRPPANRSSRTVAGSSVLQLASVMVPTATTPAAFTPFMDRGRTDGFSRIWRMVEWEDALQIAGSSLPYIEGLPVVAVLFQPGAPGERATVIVSQQDPSGEVIQSIEGPVDRVTELLQGKPDTHASDLTRTQPDYVELPDGRVKRTMRVLTVTGRISVDSLNTLVKRATIR